MTLPLSSFPKNKIKVVLLENIHPSAVALLAGEGFQIEQHKAALAGDALRERLADAHLIGIRSKTQLRAADLAVARRLLSVGCFCIGTNQVDLDDANRGGLPVFNAPY